MAHQDGTTIPFRRARPRRTMPGSRTSATGVLCREVPLLRDLGDDGAGRNGRQRLDESRDRRRSTVTGDFARLRWLGVVLPVVFVIGLEIVRVTADRPRPGSASRAPHPGDGDHLRGRRLRLAHVLVHRASAAPGHPPEPRAGGGQRGLDRRPGRARASTSSSTRRWTASSTRPAPPRPRSRSSPATGDRTARAGSSAGSSSRAPARRRPTWSPDVPHLIDIPLSTGTDRRRPDAAAPAGRGRRAGPARPRRPSRTSATSWPARSRSASSSRDLQPAQAGGPRPLRHPPADLEPGPARRTPSAAIVRHARTCSTATMRSCA